MSDRRLFRLATTSARLLAGTVVSAVAVVAVVTAVSVPWPTLQREPVSVAAVPQPADTVVACAGGLLTIGRISEQAGGLEVAARQSLTSGVGQGSPEPEVRHLEIETLGSVDGPAVLTAAPEGRSRTDVTGAGSSTVTAPDLSGYAASACRPPLTESWLVGGSAATGAADLLLLSNPAAVPATVQVTVYGASGPQTPPGGANLIVAAGSQRVVPLAGLALGEESPVIQVSATGAPVHATLQASITRTLLPGGVDQVGAVPEPATELTIAGVAVPARQVTQGAAAGGSSSLVRLLSPAADGAATVTVTPIGANEPAQQAETVPMTAGIPVELALADLSPGAYTVSVVADQPVVAAVWQTTGFGAGADFAWYTPAPEVTETSLFATPAGPQPTLSLVNRSGSPAVVSVDSVDGQTHVELTVPAGGSVTTRLTSRTVYALDPGGVGVHAAISLSGDGALAGHPLWPANSAAQPVTVYP